MRKKPEDCKKRGPEKNRYLEERIGARIFLMRRRRRFTLEVLSQRAGLHLNTVHKAENGGGCTVLTLCRIALALRSGLDALVPLSETYVNPAHISLSNKQSSDKIRYGTERLFEDSGPALSIDSGSSR
jgi:transcriptional regulator with XRE-family HTH domain